MKKAIKATMPCWKLGRILLIPVLFFALSFNINAQCTLSCEGTVQVSLDTNCEARISPAVMLSDDGASCPDGNFVVELSNQYGPIPGNVLTAANIGETISAKVLETNSGNSCWGYIILEDKLGPKIEFCPSAPIELSCAAFDEYVGPVFIDACEGMVDAILLSEKINPLDCNVNYVKEIIRVYYALDSKGFASEQCTLTYLLRRIDWDDIQCPDSYLVSDDTALNCDGKWKYTDCHIIGLDDFFDLDRAFSCTSLFTKFPIQNNNWTLDNDGGYRGCVASGNSAKTPIIFTTFADSDLHSETTLCIEPECDGTIFFRGSVINTGLSGFGTGTFGYTNNGVETTLTTFNAHTPTITSNTYKVKVYTGEEFCYKVTGNRSLIGVYDFSFWGNEPVFDPDRDGVWDENGNGYPDVDEVDVPKLNGIPIYPTPDFYCNAGVFYTDVQLPQINCIKKVMRVWSIREWWCGNEYEETCTQIIEIKDLSPPEVVCPKNMTVTTNTSMAPFETSYHGTVSCGADLSIPLPNATDNCGMMHYSITYPGGFKDNYDGIEKIKLPMGTNLITLRVYDECYNSTECEFYVDVVDNTAPVTICDEFTVVALTYPGEAYVHASTFDDGSYDDCKLKKTLARRMNPACDCEHPEFPDVHYLGTYNDHHYYVSHKNMPGHLAFKLGYAMGGYITTISSQVENDWITDAVKGYSDDQFLIGLSDAANEGYFKWQNGEPVDYLNWDGYFSPIYDDGDYVALDRLTGKWLDHLPKNDAKYIFEVEDSCGFSSKVKFCCEDLAQDDHMVIFRTIDSYGNYNDCMVTVEVQDKLVPRIVCPKDTIVHCDMAYDLNDMKRFGEAFVTENCEVTMTEIVHEDLNQCNTGTIRRTFYATNSNGVQDSCHQYITFINPNYFEYDDIDWPEDKTDFPGCDNPDNFGPDVTGRPAFNSDVCDLIGANYEDQVFIFNGETEAGCFKILRHWTVIDWCQTYNDEYSGLPKFRTWSRQQIIKVTNIVAPQIEECADTTICHYDPNCGDALITLSASASDDCTTNLKWSYNIDYWRNGSYDVIAGDTLGEADAFGVTTATARLHMPDGRHRILWEFYDNCGNLTTCTELFEVKNCKAPTAYCINGLAVDLMPIDSTGDGVFDFGMVQLWASDFDAGSHHPCTDEIFLSFTADTTDRFMEFDCSTLGDQPVNIYVSIVGANGDLIQSYCETYVNVQDNNNACAGGSGATIQTRIAGNIRTEMSENIEEVRVALEGSDEIEMTNTDGDYAFPDMPSGGSYVVNPLKNDNPLNGVSTLDLVLIQRHVLGTQVLDSPYKIIAGDINKDNEISAIDLIELRKLILGIYDDIPNNTSWRFVDDAYTFVDATNPLIENFNEVYNIPTLSTDMIIDFTGVKIGDVNNSSVSNILGANSDSRNNQEFKLQARAHTKLNANQIMIPVYSQETGGLYGMQFTLAIHPNAKFVSITSDQINVDQNNVGLRSEANGLISFSWNTNTLITIDSDLPLFSIVLEQDGTEQITYPIDINSELTVSEAYASLSSISKPTLNYLTEEGDASNFKLYQNIPNPFRSTTEIKFALPSASRASLSITDVTGKLVKLIEGNFVQGINTVEISSDDLHTNGFLYYTLKTDNNKATMKMVLVK